MKPLVRIECAGGVWWLHKGELRKQLPPTGDYTRVEGGGQFKAEDYDMIDLRPPQATYRLTVKVEVVGASGKVLAEGTKTTYTMAGGEANVAQMARMKAVEAYRDVEFAWLPE